MKTKSITKNYLYNTIYQIVTIIIPVATTPYISRVLGADGIGINSYTVSIVAYFILFANLGVSSYGVREIAVARDNKEKYSRVFWELNLLKLITGLISILTYVIFICINNQYNLIYLILGLNLLANIIDINWLYQGLEQYKFISIRNIIIKVLFTISIFIFVKNKEHLNLYILLNSMSLIISSFILWIKVPKLITKTKIKITSAGKHVKNTLIYFLPQVATTVYTVLDKTMIGIITQDSSENGYYEQAYKIISMTFTVLTSLNTVMLPRMAYLFENKKIHEIKTRLAKSLKFVFLLGFPFMFGIVAITNNFVGWFYGEGFEKLNYLLPLFTPLIIIIGISNCLGGQLLTPIGKRLQSAIVLWIGAIVNFVLNLILIPMYQSTGALLGSIAAELVITSGFIYLSRKFLKNIKILKDIIKYAIFSLIMAIPIYALSNLLDVSLKSTIIQVIIAIVIYFVLLVLSKDEILIDFWNKVSRKATKNG